MEGHYMPWYINMREQCTKKTMYSISSVQFSGSAVSDSLRPHGLQHARPLCPSSTPRVASNSCPLSQWCHLTISSSVIPFCSRVQSFPASGSFPMSQVFTSGGQSIGVSASASVLLMIIQDCIPFLGAWCPLPAFRSCFVEFTRRLNALFMNLWGRKCSPCPTPLPSWLLPSGPNQTLTLLHSKGSHQQNEMTAYGIGENTCEWCSQQGVNVQKV